MDNLTFNSIMFTASHAFFFITMTDGVRRMASRPQQPYAVTLFVVGLVMLTIVVSVHLWGWKVLTSSIDELADTSNVATYIPDDWNKDIEPRDRSERSRFYAEIIYDRRGTLVEYFDPEGKRTLFAPTQKDLDSREKYVVALAGVRNSLAGLYRMVVASLIYLAVSIATGIMLSRLKVPRKKL